MLPLSGIAVTLVLIRRPQRTNNENVDTKMEMLSYNESVVFV